jgi:lipid-A-disaccharide synthase-like uncharacterized protein
MDLYPSLSKLSVWIVTLFGLLVNVIYMVSLGQVLFVICFSLALFGYPKKLMKVLGISFSFVIKRFFS